jgi:hypothetical protein
MLRLSSDQDLTSNDVVSTKNLNNVRVLVNNVVDGFQYACDLQLREALFFNQPRTHRKLSDLVDDLPWRLTLEGYPGVARRGDCPSVLLWEVTLSSIDHISECRLPLFDRGGLIKRDAYGFGNVANVDNFSKPM